MFVNVRDESNEGFFNFFWSFWLEGMKLRPRHSTSIAPSVIVVFHWLIRNISGEIHSFILRLKKLGYKFPVRHCKISEMSLCRRNQAEEPKVVFAFFLLMARWRQNVFCLMWKVQEVWGSCCWKWNGLQITVSSWRGEMENLSLKNFENHTH